MTKSSLSIRVICIDPSVSDPTNPKIRFGLQDKKKQLVDGTQTSAGDLVFEFVLDVKKHSDDTPNFTGVYAHGTRAERFVYLTLMNLEGESWTIIRRIKIPLKTITWAQVQTLIEDDSKILQVTVSGQGSATVPLLNGGWTIQEKLL